MAPSRKRKQKVHVHFLAFPGTSGIGASSARVSPGQVTNYIRKGAAKLESREQIHNKDSHRNGGQRGGHGGVPDGCGAIGDFENEDLNLQLQDRDDGDPEFVIHRKSRSSSNDRQCRAANWQRTEAILADMMLQNRLLDTCVCTRCDVVTVRCIDLNSYEHREFQYCIRHQSSSCLLNKGYFPCAPIKPRTAFSIRLLQLLHEQSVLGYVNSSAWSGGLRALFESEKKAVLLAFDREVSTSLYLLGPLNTERV